MSRSLEWQVLLRYVPDGAGTRPGHGTTSLIWLASYPELYSTQGTRMVEEESVQHLYSSYYPSLDMFLSQNDARGWSIAEHFAEEGQMPLGASIKSDHGIGAQVHLVDLGATIS
jgi:hypothetical protein